MNKKSKLLARLKNKNILIKNKNKTYLKFDSFRSFEIKESFLENKDCDEILILKKNNIVFEYWIKQDLIIPPWETHWFQLRDGFLLKLKDNSLNNLLDKAIKQAGNLNKLCQFLDMTTPSFYNFLNGKIYMISVKKLRRLLSYIDAPYIGFNKKIEYTKKGSKISIEHPRFPLNLNSKYGASILGAVTSDGCVYIDKKARGVVRTKYSTSESESIEYFIKGINKIYGNVHIQKEIVRNCTILKIGSSIIGDSLLKVGAILGHKAKENKGVPWIINCGPYELKKYYLRAVFSDEGCVYVGKKYGYIVLSRYKHISNLTKYQKKRLGEIERYMSIRKFPTGHINKSITIKRALKILSNDKKMVIILKSIPNLLLDESKILNSLSISYRIWSKSLNKTHLGRYSLCCDLYINKIDSIIKFYKEIGFSLEGKQNKLRKITKIDGGKIGIENI